MFLERPSYIPEKEWNDIVSRYEGMFAAWEMEKFSPSTEYQHFSLVLATWGAERASKSAPHKHSHLDLMRFR